jgi:diphosphomevalonate decarboxylase
MNGSARAIARSNIALVKYWGKSERGGNLTAVPSLSLTLEGLKTTTTVSFDASLGEDEVMLEGALAKGRPFARVSALLDELRSLAQTRLKARVTSSNDFPTASGLASSASGFAALAFAAQAALGLGLSREAVSRVARRASASAARSLFAGFVELLAEAESATAVAAPDFWDLVMVVAATTLGPKATASTDGMLHTQRTSPYYPAWVSAAPATFERAKRALLERDFDALGAVMEYSTMMMHASMFAAEPSLCYWRPASLSVIERVRALRAEKVPAYFTMDAGPHVKVLVERRNADAVAGELARVPGVERILTSGPGLGAELVEA